MASAVALRFGIAAVSVIALLLLTCQAGTGTRTSLSSQILQAVENRIAHGETPMEDAPYPGLSNAIVQEYAANNTLIVTFANANHIDYTINWVSYLNKLNISNYIVGAMDVETAQAMADHSVHHFNMSDGLAQSLPKLPAVWLKDPLPYLARYPEASILASSDAVSPTFVDGGLEDPEIMRHWDLNTGFMLIRHSKSTAEFLAAWDKVLQQQDRHHWDQADFNDLLRINMFASQPVGPNRSVREANATLASKNRTIWGWDHNITVGALPITMFANGHVFFAQRLHQTLQTPLYTVHANYILNAGIKKLLFRETLMWQADQASYYAVEGLLMFNLRSLEAPQDWLELPVQAQLQFHSQNLAAQIIQFWDAAAATIALDRVLILPQFVCYCDEGWLSGQCERAGVVNQSLPFNCPPDYVVNLLNMDDDPLHFGVSLKWRESTFLSHSKTPVATKIDIMKVPVQQIQLAPQHVNHSQALAPWSVTEHNLREALDKYKHHKVLHFEEIGHVLLDTHRQWSRRRAHATYAW